MNEAQRTSWEQTRIICYNIAKFGNSDPKSFPRSINRFWQFDWDVDEVAETKHHLFEAARQLRQQLQQQQQ